MNKANQYDDPDFFYKKYWQGREYEHAAEELAIRKFLSGKHFENAADVGGGYGRLSKLLAEFSDHVTLIEPSKKQRDEAKQFLAGLKKIKIVDGQTDRLPVKDGSLDLVAMIRVMHHLPNPLPAFAELNRVLDKGGLLMLEIASSAHAKGRLRAAAHLSRIPRTPIDIRSPENRNKSTIAFVNHHPKTVITQLADSGFEKLAVLSVSNLRIPRLKKLLPKKQMLELETRLQKPLAPFYFGPSIFVLARKK